MPLSWNEIRDRALTFSKEWADETSEDAEAKSFWDGFFNIFGVTRRRLASFEEPVKKSNGSGGFIDLLWRGVLLVEHKSRGKDLDRAVHQAFEYFPGLKERDLPRYVLVSDFARFRLYDLDEQATHEFGIRDLSKNVRLFGFMAGYQSRSFGKEDAVNIRAAERLGKLHDLLKASGYEGHPLEVLLVRLLFCVFAEDTGIFERRQFTDWIEQRTSEDGSDMGPLLNNLFEVLDTPPEKRHKSLDEQLAGFPYVNGKLYAETLRSASFDRSMRETLLDCTALDWSQISPAIFGSLFQSIMDTKARRDLGAHYTTETNIRKALGPLFLDGLWAELGKLKASKMNAKRLIEFHAKLAGITVLDPACGCGNFLVIAYQELRMLELDLLREMHKHRETGFLDVASILFVDVDQFYGIEIEEFPAQIAQVALWLTDHQMNMKVSDEFGQYFVRLPLKKAPNVVNGNALTLDWATLVVPEKLSYIVGNPPFRGSKFLSDSQRAEVSAIFGKNKNAGLLDYVTCWHRKATDYMEKNPVVRTAFVSTNSITQGEQVGALWPDLLSRGVKIHFAHRTFQWSSEARGKAAVHCVIIGFALHDSTEKVIFDYDSPQGEPHAIKASNINPYLVEGADIIAMGRMTPLFSSPAMINGSIPADGGNLVLERDERDALVAVEPAAADWLRLYLGAEGFIRGNERWCLWLKDCSPATLQSMPRTLARVTEVSKMRKASSKEATRDKAQTPYLFTEDRQPTEGSYLALPRTSSENRPYIPIGYLPASTVAANDLQIVPGADEYAFGVLSSAMHMAWVRVTAGRLKSDYRYSTKCTYNTFPWPEPDDRRRDAVASAGRAVLEARAAHPESSLADLYSPITMPSDLVAAHRKLDKAVDAAYGKANFASEAERVAFLFKRYQEAVTG